MSQWTPDEPTEYEKYQKKCREELKRTRELIHNYREEVEKVQLNCEACGSEILEHYGELTVSIQPHVVKDGSFWKIDSYRPDTLQRRLLCEPCIIKLKHDVVYNPNIQPYTWDELWALIKQRVHLSWKRFRS
jgi:hypothetical protein